MSDYYGRVNGLMCDTRRVLSAYTLQANELLRSGFQCRGGVWLSGKLGDMADLFQRCAS